MDILSKHVETMDYSVSFFAYLEMKEVEFKDSKQKMKKKKDMLKITEMAKDYATTIGMCIRSTLFYNARVTVPFTLFPSPFPKNWYELVKSIQTDLNHVLHKVSHSADFISSCIESLAEVDEFVKHIFSIYKTVQKDGILQPISLGLIRSDYLLDSNASGRTIGIKQVENNTISTANSAIASKVSDLHAFTLTRLGLKHEKHELPKNEAHVNVAKGIVTAWKLYNNENAIIIFVVEDLTINIGDQRLLEFAIYELEIRIQIHRYTFRELRSSVTLVNNRLFINSDKEVALVYYRHGYLPEHYQVEDWTVRLLIERSLAIKCPTVGYHLAGTKRIQYELTRPGVLEKFLTNNSDAQKLRQVFAKQFSLDTDIDAITLALENPSHYVLKPEREGGGNNIYDDDLVKVLRSIKTSELRKSYILMEKINSPHVKNMIIRDSKQPKTANIICELGIYGVIIGTEQNIYANIEAGHIIKSKEFSSNESGIVAGFGAADSPFLV